MEPIQKSKTLLVMISGIVGLIIGFLIGTQFTQKAAVNDAGNAETETSEKVQDMSQGNNLNPATSTNGQVDSTLVLGNPSDVAFSVSISSLSTSQQAALRAMGISGDKFVVTKGMVACSEAKIGAPRVKEIQNGAIPSISEGVALMGCYKS